MTMMIIVYAQPVVVRDCAKNTAYPTYDGIFLWSAQKGWMTAILLDSKSPGKKKTTQNSQRKPQPIGVFHDMKRENPKCHKRQKRVANENSSQSSIVSLIRSD